VTDAEVVTARLRQRARPPNCRHHFAGGISPRSCNPDQAAKLPRVRWHRRIDSEASIVSGDSGTAAINVRAARASIGRATQLLGFGSTLAVRLRMLAALAAAVADTE
jgi:hypothetical protein